MENSVKNRTHTNSPPVSRDETSPTGKGGKTRSRESSGGQGSAHQQNTVKEAVAIAAGKKGVGQSEEDEGKSAVKSNMLCYLYWLLVILIMGLISFTVWLSIKLARRHSSALLAQGGMDGSTNPFKFDDLFDEKLKPRTFNVEWFHDPQEGDAFTYRAENGSLMVHYVSTNRTEELMDKSIFDELKTDKYYVSHDLNYVLIEYDIRKKWRHSREARYKIYERKGRPGKTRLPDFPANMELRKDRLQYARWAPTTTALLFVYKNDIYYQKNPREFAKRLTTTGNVLTVFNGLTDWIYDEEILKDSIATWWSPDSRYFCYASINDSRVPHFRFSSYGHSDDIIEFTLPRAIGASEAPTDWNTLPHVSVYIVDTDNIDGRHVLIAAPEELSGQHYLTQVVWKDNSHVAVAWSNRAQNKTITRISDVDGRFTFNNLYQTSNGGWIETRQPMVFMDDKGERMATIWPRLDEDLEYWNQLAIISLKEGEELVKTFVTKGHQEVKSIVGYDRANKFIYYLSTNDDPKQQHLYRLSTDLITHGGYGTPHCMTCNISTSCLYVSASFSRSGLHYILGCLGPDVPTYRLMSVDGFIDAMLEDNDELTRELQKRLLPKREFIEIPIGGRYKAWAEIVRPNFDEDDDNPKKYPLLVEANDEPGTSKVTEKFELGWKTYLASSEEVVYVTVDVRGSSSRGQKYRNEVHRSIGTTDVDDQLLAGVFLKEIKYIDPAKAAIWGWSYGGFVTSHSVANETDVFPCGIAGSPITDLHYYNSAKYERLLGLSDADDNRSGYEKTDLLKKIQHFKNKKYLLIHGTADDNIPFASSSRLVKALTDADVQFRFQLYTDIGGYSMPDDRHVYRLMTEFLKNECYSFFWKHDTKSWLVDRAVKKERFRIKQFCV